MMREDRSKSFKKGIDANEGRRRRDDTRIQLRKNKREEGLAKRRTMEQRNEAPSGNGSAGANAPVTADKGGKGEEKKVFTVADIPQLLAGLSGHGTGDGSVLESVRGFRRMLTMEQSPPVKEVISSGALPLFVQLLSRYDNPSIQFEATWALTNVASTDQTQVVVDQGAVPFLVSLMHQSPNADVREQSAWCLGNIAGDSADLRDYCLHAGAMEPFLLNVHKPASKSLLQNVVWALSNLCRGKPQPELHLVAPAMPYLASLVNSENPDVMMDSVWALSYLSDGDDIRIQAVIDTGVVPKLVSLLSHESSSVVTPALRTLGNFVSGNDTQTQTVLDAGVLAQLGHLLRHGRKNVRKETCWLLSNIAAGTKPQISSLMAMPNEMAAVVNAAISAEWEVRKEATWIISNIATGGNDKHIAALVELGGIEAVCSVLDLNDAKIVMVALEAVENILQAGGRLGHNYECFFDEAEGLDKLEGLQQHENNDIYERAVHIIEAYFGADDVEDENLAPVANENGTFSFGLPTKNTDGIESEDFSQQPLQPFNFGTAANFDFSE